MANKDTNADNSLFTYDGKPSVAKIIPISLQHVMAMFVGTVTVPMVVANACGVSDAERQLLIQFALLMAGISTLIQLYPIKIFGARVPTVFSVGFTFVPTLTADMSFLSVKVVACSFPSKQLYIYSVLRLLKLLEL